MATLIKPENYEQFFLWEEETGAVIPCPIQPKDLGEIVGSEDKIGHKNCKAVFKTLWEENIAHYTKFLQERKLRIEYDKRTNEISLIKYTL